MTYIIKSQDTVFLKQPFYSSGDKISYKTDTVIFEGSLHKHILIGTTVMPWTHNQMIAKNYGLNLEKVIKSDCKGDATIQFIPDKINSITNKDNELIIDINISDNCCYSFLCDIEIKDNSILNLINYGYGTYCDCDCCFGLTYTLSKDNFPEFKKIKSVMINGNKKTLKLLK